MQSQGIYEVVAQEGYTGALEFHSRDGGAYGNHTYVIRIGASNPGPGPVVDAGGQVVMRDGVEFPADWNTYRNDAGKGIASPWANELYDGIMATFSSDTPAVTDCLSSNYTGYIGQLAITERHACQVLDNTGNGLSMLVVEPLELGIGFNGESDQVAQIYTYWWGGATTCSTTTANQEAMDWAGIGPGSVGGLTQGFMISNPRGLTYTEANSVWCNGTQVASPPDPGFGAIAWGQSGEVLMEYALDGGLNYKIYAQNGYKGFFSICVASTPDTTCWGFQLGQAVTALSFANGSTTGTPLGPYSIDWSTSSATATTFANGVCGTSDTDCASSGDCTFLPNDGKGNSYLGFSCGTGHDEFGVSFTQGTNIPTQFVSVNPHWVY
jgi:hypothetical protein